MKRHAKAVWNGSGKEGSGHISVQSTLFTDAQYSFSSRFAEGVGTNPEELVAAAHAACFSMKLSFSLGGAGFTPETLETTCTITLSPEKGAITLSHLVLKAKVPGISKEQFDECVEDAKNNCPVSKLLNAEISVESKLHG